MSTHDGGSGNTLATLHRAFDIVSLLREKDGARVPELAAEMDIAPSTVHKYLTTLRDEELVVKEGYKYHVGMKFLDIASYVKTRKEGYELCIQKVTDLAKKTGERAQFIIEENGEAVYVETKAFDDSAVRMNRHPGITRPLHATSGGKAILAHLPEYRVDRILEEQELTAQTEHTITDIDLLNEELEQIREARVAFNDEESVEDLRAVGVPIHGRNGLILGALSVSAPSNRLTGDRYREKIPNLLLGHANEIELNLRYP